jgi:hypothetical protein
MSWWEGLDPLEVDGPAGHALAWREGVLVLPAHPDPEAEEALAALGGERCPCLDLLAAWSAQHERPSILTVGPRRLDEELVAPARVTAELRDDVNRWRSHLAELLAEARVRKDTAALARLAEVARGPERAAARRLGFLYVLALPVAVQVRLIGSVADALASTGREDELEVPTAARGGAGRDWLATVWAHGKG